MPIYGRVWRIGSLVAGYKSATVEGVRHHTHMVSDTGDAALIS